MQFCEPCIKHKRKEYKTNYQKQNRKLVTGFSREEENQFLIQCVKSGIDTTGKIRNEYKRLDRKARSQAWLIKTLKKLGIYQPTDNKTHNLYLFEKFKIQREKQIFDWGYTIQSNSTNEKNVKVKCNTCNTITGWRAIKRSEGKCFKCEVKRRKEEREQIKSENLDKINSAKNKEYISRIDRINQFLNKGIEVWNNYNSWKETPVYKEYKWYKSKEGIEYRDIELDYKLGYINYYILMNTKECPDKTKEGYKICNRCKEEKNIEVFAKDRNTCKGCAKEYRREYLLPNEIRKSREKYNNDPLFKLDSLIRAYVYGALKGRLKTKRTKEILGIEWHEFKKWIEDRFEDWMNWDNHGSGEGKWALQHIVPREFATNEKEIYLLNHYKNFIPMCAIQNGILKNRVIEEQLTGWHVENKGIQKILKRNKDKIIKENEFITQYNITEIKPTNQTEQKLNKWFAF